MKPFKPLLLIVLAFELLGCSSAHRNSDLSSENHYDEYDDYYLQLEIGVSLFIAGQIDHNGKRHNIHDVVDEFFEAKDVRNIQSISLSMTEEGESGGVLVTGVNEAGESYQLLAERYERYMLRNARILAGSNRKLENAREIHEHALQLVSGMARKDVYPHVKEFRKTANTPVRVVRTAYNENEPKWLIRADYRDYDALYSGDDLIIAFYSELDSNDERRSKVNVETFRRQKLER
jgi:hypothetical protein